MAFFFASSASNSEPTSISSSPNVATLDNLEDDHNQSRGGETLLTLAWGSSSPRHQPFSRGESEIYTTATNPGLDPFTFDVDMDASRMWASSSRSSSYTKSSSSSESGFSFNGSERDVSPTLTQGTLGEASHSDSNTVLIPASASSAPTIKHPAILSKDKGKAPAYPNTMQTDPQGHRRRSSSGEAKSRRKHRRVKTVHEKGISRDFLLIVALCIGLACAGILVVRPAILAIFGRGSFDLEDL